MLLNIIMREKSVSDEFFFPAKTLKYQTFQAWKMAF